MWAVVTAYCLLGITASGAPVGPGTIATRDRSIPFGTALHVPGYGWGVVRDRLPASSRADLDVWYSRCGDAIWWGRQRHWISYGGHESDVSTATDPAAEGRDTDVVVGGVPDGPAPVELVGGSGGGEAGADAEGG